MNRLWGILTVLAIAALFLSALLGVISLVFAGIGGLTGQLAFAGFSELLLSFVFLVAGVGTLYAVVRSLHRSGMHTMDRGILLVGGLFCGVCWTIAGASGLIFPQLLTFLFHR